MEKFKAILGKFTIDKDNCFFYIEEPFMRYQKGRSSATTIIKLSNINSIISYNIYKIWEKPVHINAVKARSVLNIKKKKGEDVKEVVLSWVVKKYKSFRLDKKEISRGKRKGQIVNTKQTYDMADAVVIGQASIEMFHK